MSYVTLKANIDSKPYGTQENGGTTEDINIEVSDKTEQKISIEQLGKPKQRKTHF